MAEDALTTVEVTDRLREGYDALEWESGEAGIIGPCAICGELATEDDCPRYNKADEPVHPRCAAAAQVREGGLNTMYLTKKELECVQSILGAFADEGEIG